MTYFRGVPRCVTKCGRGRESKLVQHSMTYFMDGPKLRCGVQLWFKLQLNTRYLFGRNKENTVSKLVFGLKRISLNCLLLIKIKIIKPFQETLILLILENSAPFSHNYFTLPCLFVCSNVHSIYQFYLLWHCTQWFGHHLQVCIWYLFINILNLDIFYSAIKLW